MNLLELNLAASNDRDIPRSNAQDPPPAHHADLNPATSGIYDVPRLLQPSGLPGENNDKLLTWRKIEPGAPQLRVYETYMPLTAAPSHRVLDIIRVELQLSFIPPNNNKYL